MLLSTYPKTTEGSLRSPDVVDGVVDLALGFKSSKVSLAPGILASAFVFGGLLA